MKKILIALLVLMGLASCVEKEITVTVKNTADFKRSHETVEIPWSELQKINPAVAEDVVVTDENGSEIPSQLIYKGSNLPQSLIFQVTVDKHADKTYKIVKGKATVYESKVFGRLIPERKDDFAWENDKIIYRIYGPALEATGEISNGIDVWMKSTSELVIDRWYQANDYHVDHGEGMDAYKVGRTLGGGAMAPYWNGELVLGNNFISHEIIEKGPVRFSFKLTYAPYKVGEKMVIETRLFSIDAGSRLTKVESTFADAPAGMQVAAGIVLREGGEQMTDLSKGIAAYWEPQNNDNNVNNGHIAVGVIIPEGITGISEQEGHLLAIADYNSKPIVYYIASGWSKAGIDNAAAWFEIMNSEATMLSNPLKVMVK
ncbi:MAG: DUF4861 domain-containing protein [Culturomica sp.]|jgi:hypothetical protein|nr:DUF4861 domain-containing protein [Culturomica sp.]